VESDEARKSATVAIPGPLGASLRTTIKLTTLTKRELFKEIKATGIIVSVIAFLIILISLIDIRSTPFIPIISFFAYILLAFIVNSLNSSFKNKFFELLNKIIWYPLAIFYGLLTVFIICMTLFVHVIFYFLISFLIPYVIIETLSYFHLIDFLKFSTIVYQCRLVNDLS
jgi:hypothetical protein